MTIYKIRMSSVNRVLNNVGNSTIDVYLNENIYTQLEPGEYIALDAYGHFSVVGNDFALNIKE